MIGANKSVSKEEEKRKCDVKRSSRIQLCNATTMAAKKTRKTLIQQKTLVSLPFRSSSISLT